MIGVHVSHGRKQKMVKQKNRKLKDGRSCGKPNNRNKMPVLTIRPCHEAGVTDGGVNSTTAEPPVMPELGQGDK